MVTERHVDVELFYSQDTALHLAGLVTEEVEQKAQMKKKSKAQQRVGF